jgi:hypothetical protein
VTPAYRAARTTTVSTAHGPARHTRHHLNLTGARVVHTPQIDAITTALHATVDRRGMMCLTGLPGTGKTFTLHAVLDQNPSWVPVRLLLSPQGRPQDLRHALHRALDLPGEPPKDPGISDDLIRHALHYPQRLLALDEAHQLSASCLEYLRYLYDDPRTNVALVLAASSHRVRALRTTAVLAGRVTCWHELAPLTQDQVPAAVPALHSTWRDSDPTALLHLDTAWAHGNFRRWATLTHRRVSITARTGLTAGDPHALLRRLTPGHPPEEV